VKELRERYAACQKCSKCLHKVKVFGCGNLTASIAIIGDSPGKDEVATTTPFVGEAGKLLDGILAAIDLVRDDLFFTNAMLCRTDDKNRMPTVTEYSNCRDRLFQELTIVRPRYALLLGNTAIRSVMGSENYKMSETHGKWFTHLNEPCYFYFSIYHPSWILQASTDSETKMRKKIMWDDIRKWRDDMKSFNENMKFNQEKNETK